VILPLAALLEKVKVCWPAAFRRLATEKGFRPVVVGLFSEARFSPELVDFFVVLFAPCRFAPFDLVTAAAGPSFPPVLDLVAVVVAAAVVAAFGLAAAVADSAAIAFAAPGPDFVVVAGFASAVGFVCSFLAEMERGKGRAVAAIFCSLTPRSSF